MRIERVRLNEVSEEIFGQAFENANAAMDNIVLQAKAKLAASVNSPPIVREGHFGSAHVSFIPKTGKNKGKSVEFDTDKRWTGRHYTDIDTLIETIRRVNSPGKNNVRVYAGNFKAYWAFMVEKGFTDRGGEYHPGVHYLEQPFHMLKMDVTKKIKDGK